MKLRAHLAGILTLLAFTFGMSAGMAAFQTASADTAVPTPDNDPFYTPPAGYQSLPNGTILNSRTINAEIGLPIFSTDVTTLIAQYGQALLPKFAQLQNLKINAYQVLYKSSDTHGQPVAEAVTILVPQGPWSGNGTRPLVAYETAEDSIQDFCQPSYTLRVGMLGQPGSQSAPSQSEIAQSMLPLLEGYAVAYPDYEGPQSQLVAGVQIGQASLDSIRATLSYAPAGLSPATQVALWGYSGGGGAAGWAAALKQTYAPELNIVGAAIGAPANGDLQTMYLANNGQLSSGLVAMALVGLTRAYPESRITPYMNAAGVAMLNSVANASWGCGISDSIGHALVGPLEIYTIAPWVPLQDSAPGKFLFTAASLSRQPYVPSMPILSYNDEYDNGVPVKGDDEMAVKWCQAGANVEVVRESTPFVLPSGNFDGLTVHIINGIMDSLPAVNYLKNRFNGLPPRNDCATSAQWSAGKGASYYSLQTQ